MKPEGYFSPDYATARARFREAGAAAGAALHAIALSAQGPRGEPLAIDIAWLGASRPKNVLLHTSGMHGVEAYTGSAVQLALLDSPPPRGIDEALVLVHVLNPYGMAWLRRTNENNVDLNRNFLLNGERWSGAPELYRTLDPLLNPPTPPSHDGFAVRAAAIAMRRGFHRVKQAVAQGQYEFERGLFYGGRELEEGPKLLCEWLSAHLGFAGYVFGLDLHTGLGRRGTDTVLAEPHVGATAPSALGRALGRTLVESEKPSVAYMTRGSFGSALPHVLPRSRIDFVVQEIGTNPPLKVLHALREENRAHFYAGGALTHPAKSRLREALCPASVEWRRKAIARGVSLARAAARWSFGNER
jgi:hypothetical protein